jgi:hypothetical protein
MVALAFAPLTFYLAGLATEGIALGARAAERARSSRDTAVAMYALTHIGLNLGSAGRYVEATEVSMRFGNSAGNMASFRCWRARRRCKPGFT